MNLTNLKGNRDFWDTFAPWYERWASRGQYHKPILYELSQMIEQGWKVLDIGAATGVLSIPMASLGCSVHALEPSNGMQEILKRKLSELNIKVDTLQKRWEDYEGEKKQFNLILACNSLHLTEGGIKGGMRRVFEFLPEYVCLITEINQSLFIDFREIDSLQKDYQFLYIRNYRCDSSFIFENQSELDSFKETFNLDIETEEVDGRLIQKDWTDIAVLWWERLS